MASTLERSSVFRPEIEGLRAVAFLLVAIFHVWGGRVSGGVDVFFTVAGFLVALTLMSHVRRFGRIRPGLFLSRLARRLLPAAALVLVAVLLLTILVMPFSRWGDTFWQVLASATYWENWFLAFNAVDYLAVDVSRSPVQHFWAMSIQGQFYVIWLVLFIAAVWFARRSSFSVRRVASAAIAVVVAVSFLVSVVQTETHQEFAYFSTWTRVWEFGLGALVALVIERVRLHRAVAAVLSWVALAVILATGMILPVADVFPGYVALLPVTAAIVIIIAGRQEAGWGAGLVLGSKPLVWLGGLGYGVYLWHWPILIFVLEIQDRETAGPLTGMAVIGSAIVLSVATRFLIERPIGRSPAASRGGRLAIAIALVAGIVVAVGAPSGLVVVDERAKAEKRALDKLSSSECFGARALGDANCEVAPGEDSALPSSPSADSPEIFNDRCATSQTGTELKVCTWGDPQSDKRIALIGNSHGAVWFPAFREIAEREGWRLDTYFKYSCAFNTSPRELPTQWRESCSEWSDRLSAHLAMTEPYQYVATSAVADNDHFNNKYGDIDPRAGVTGYHEVWQPLIDRGSTVVAIRDYPTTSRWVRECGLDDATADCARSLESAQVPFDDEVLAIAGDEVNGAVVVDMTRWFCDGDSCPAVVGGVHVYSDDSHFTATYGRSLADPLGVELRDQAGVTFD